LGLKLSKKERTKNKKHISYLMKTKRLFVPRVKTALALLPSAKRRAIVSNKQNAKQTFRNIIARLSNGRPVEEQKLKAIAKAAATRALPSKKKRLKEKELVVIIAEGLTDGFAFRFMQNKRSRRKRLLFKNGVLADLVMVHGMQLAGYGMHGCAIRAKIVPTKIPPQLREQLRWKREGSDFSKDVLGSIGHIGFTINREETNKKPVMMIHNVQQRFLSEMPKSLQAQLQNWKMEAIRALEEECKHQQIDKILVVSRKSHYEKTIGEEYASLEEKLKKQGFKLLPVRNRPVGGMKHYTRYYWVKQIS